MKDKKSFLIYCDLIHTVNKMPDDKAGLLFKHLLAYVNDLNPITDDLIVELTFEPIKQQLKRDLKTWNESKEIKSLAGIMGNLKRWHPDLHQKVIDNELSMNEAKVIADNRKASHTDNVQSHPIANIAVTDTVTVNVNDKVKDINKNNNSFDETSSSKNKPLVKKEPSLYVKCMDAYNSFILSDVGIPAKIDGQEGKALKAIIAYLKTASTDKTDEGVLKSFSFVLENKSRWDSFHQSQLKLSQINSNIINILKSIKNGKSSNSIKDFDAHSALERINERIKQQGAKPV